MNDIHTRFFTFGIIVGLVVAFAVQLLVAPIEAQSEALFVDTVLTSCVPYGA